MAHVFKSYIETLHELRTKVATILQQKKMMIKLNTRLYFQKSDWTQTYKKDSKQFLQIT